MADGSSGKPIIEIALLLVLVAFPLWGVIWYVSTDGGTASQSAPTTPSGSVIGSGTGSDTGSGSAGTQGQQPPVAISLENQAAFPAYVTAGQIVPFSFSLSDTGTVNGTYSYKVYVVWSDGTQDVIDINSITVAAGASARVPETLKFESATSRGEIYVEVASPKESIHFSLPRS